MTRHLDSSTRSSSSVALRGVQSGMARKPASTSNPAFCCLLVVVVSLSVRLDHRLLAVVLGLVVAAASGGLVVGWGVVAISTMPAMSSAGGGRDASTGSGGTAMGETSDAAPAAAWCFSLCRCCTPGMTTAAPRTPASTMAPATASHPCLLRRTPAGLPTPTPPPATPPPATPPGMVGSLVATAMSLVYFTVFLACPVGVGGWVGGSKWVYVRCLLQIVFWRARWVIGRPHTTHRREGPRPTQTHAGRRHIMVCTSSAWRCARGGAACVSAWGWRAAVLLGRRVDGGYYYRVSHQGVNSA